MKIITTIAEAQSCRQKKPRVLVPTMGALHKAHGELIRVAREKAGNAASLNFLKGQVMKLSEGKANPQLAGEILEKKLQG